MISETMPLNEWPSDYLKVLLFDLNTTKSITPYTREIIEVVQAAIKDVEFGQSKR
jgi:hypothetical protein